MLTQIRAQLTVSVSFILSPIHVHTIDVDIVRFFRLWIYILRRLHAQTNAHTDKRRVDTGAYMYISTVFSSHYVYGISVFTDTIKYAEALQTNTILQVSVSVLSFCG